MTSPLWDRFFTVAPLILVGTRDGNGGDDIAPKHMASPMGWQNYMGFVCTPDHGTYQNIKRDKCFVVSWPKPDQWMAISLAASPRCEDSSKPAMDLIETFRSPTLDCPAVAGGYLYLECELDRLIDDLGSNSLIIGRVVAAQVDPSYMRAMERDDQDLLHDAPLLAYVSPGRFAVIRDSQSFPAPAGMRK